jgi:hypothetical protein
LNSSNFAVIATPQPSAVAHTIPVTLFDCVHGRLYLQRVDALIRLDFILDVDLPDPPDVTTV